MLIRPFQSVDQAAVIELWRRSGLLRPWNDPQKDIARKLKVQADWFLVGIVDAQIIASAMAGYDGHRGWVNYLAVDPAYQGQGLGRRLMQEVERLLRDAGCPKINLQVRSTNRAVIAFYRRLGYGIDEVVGLGKRLKYDDHDN